MKEGGGGRKPIYSFSLLLIGFTNLEVGAGSVEVVCVCLGVGWGGDQCPPSHGRANRDLFRGIKLCNLMIKEPEIVRHPPVAPQSRSHAASATRETMLHA